MATNRSKQMNMKQMLKATKKTRMRKGASIDDAPPVRISMGNVTNIFNKSSNSSNNSFQGHVVTLKTIRNQRIKKSSMKDIRSRIMNKKTKRRPQARVAVLLRDADRDAALCTLLFLGLLFPNFQMSFTFDLIELARFEQEMISSEAASLEQIIAEQFGRYLRADNAKGSYRQKQNKPVGEVREL